MPKGLSPLTLIGITKGLVEDEEEQRRQSRNSGTVYGASP